MERTFISECIDKEWANIPEKTQLFLLNLVKSSSELILADPENASKEGILIELAEPLELLDNRIYELEDYPEQRIEEAMRTMMAHMLNYLLGN